MDQPMQWPLTATGNTESWIRAKKTATYSPIFVSRQVPVPFDLKIADAVESDFSLPLSTHLISYLAYQHCI